MRFVRRFMVAFIFGLALVLALGVKLAYTQTDQVEPLGIDQIVSGIMQAVGTWGIAYLVNVARTKFNIIPGSVFLVIVVNVLGLGVSWLQSYLQIPGHSWVLSFFATFGAVFLSQLQAQLNTKTGAAQYKFGSVK